MKLRIIPTSEGYFDVITKQYIYNYTDHLGNVRLSYSDTNKDGIIQPRQYQSLICNISPAGNICYQGWKPGEIVEVNNYYPFGLMHNYTATTQNAYQYKYNGKELQETGMYDYGARFYMPDIGRWGVVDPLAEVYRRHSTYNYAVNNPIRFIDPDGRSVQTFSGQEAQNAYWQFYFSGSVSKVTGKNSFGSFGNDAFHMFSGDDAGMIMISALGNDGQGGGSSLSSWMQNYTSQFENIENLASISFQQKGFWDSDKDGKLSKREADRWGFEGKGSDLYVDNSKIDWKGLTIPEGKKIGDIFAISTTDAFIYLPYETAATYGGTSFRVTGKNKVEVLNQAYHYRMRPANSVENIGRNILTKIGFPKTMELYNGKFIPYTIKYINPTIIIK